eukprot:1345655-Prymnesium_polylepis.1
MSPGHSESMHVGCLEARKLPGFRDGGSLELRPVSIVLETHGLIVDPSHLTQQWKGELGLEAYLRSSSEIPDSIKMISIKGKLLLDGEPRCFFKASDRDDARVCSL